MNVGQMNSTTAIPVNSTTGPRFDNLPIPATLLHSAKLVTSTSSKLRPAQNPAPVVVAEEVAEDSFDDELPGDETMDIKLRRKLRKMNREKHKRSKLNDKFEKLSRMLSLNGGNTRIEKLTILQASLRTISELRKERAVLLQSRDALRSQLEQAKSTSRSVAETRSSSIPEPAKELQQAWAPRPAPKVNFLFPANPSGSKQQRASPNVIVSSPPKKITSWDAEKSTSWDSVDYIGTSKKKVDEDLFAMDTDDIDSQDPECYDAFGSSDQDFLSSEDPDEIGSSEIEFGKDAEPQHFNFDFFDTLNSHTAARATPSAFIF